MAAELVPEFLDFRLRAAGYAGPPLFSRKAALRLARASGGIVRRINILADKAMLAAYAADAGRVEVDHVNNAIQESSFSTKNRIVSHATTALSLVIVLLLAGIAWLLWRPPVPALMPTQAPARTAAVARTAPPALQAPKAAAPGYLPQ
jgi:hypothetical protein